MPWQDPELERRVAWMKEAVDPRKPWPGPPPEPRLCSKSLDKLILLTRIAEKFVEARGHEHFKRIAITLTWDRVPDPKEGSVLLPVIELEMGQ